MRATINVCQKGASWKTDLLKAVAYFNNCVVLQQQRQLLLCGHNKNVSKAYTLFKELLKEIRIIGREKHPDRTDRRCSMYQGLVDVLSNELYSVRKHISKELKQVRSDLPIRRRQTTAQSWRESHPYSYRQGAQIAS